MKNKDFARDEFQKEKELAERNLQLEELIVIHNKIEAELLHSNQKLEAIISATPDGIGMISLDGKLEFLSDKLIEIYGYLPEQRMELIGKSALDFIDPSDHDKIIENIQNILKEKKDTQRTEYLAIKKDNSRFYIDVNSTVLFDASGNPQNILFVERDITEQKKSEETIQKQFKQLEELNASKDKFFSIIAHDLRSPFQSLLSASDLMANDIDNLTREEIKSLSRGLNNSLLNLFGLMENLLTWSKVQRNKIEHNPVNINLYFVVTRIFDLAAQSADKKKIKFINNINSESEVYADADMLNSIIQNLTTNAIKFTNENGEIIISSIEKNDLIEVSVQDNGIGIESEKLQNLFDPNSFYSTKGTAGEKGTGLGLSLCKEFVERNGGKIWVESEIGKGSKFTFTLKKATT